MPRRTRRQKKHGILFSHRVQLLDLSKQFASIGKLGFELHPYFLTNFKAALANTRADGSLKILRLAAKIASHFAHALLNNAPQRAAPSGMEHAHSLAFRIDENDRQAIGGLHAKDKAGGISDDAVANQLGLGHGRDGVNEIRMNLTQRNQRQGNIFFTLRAKVFQKNFAIALHGFAAVCLGKTQVQARRAIGLTETSGTRAEAMYQPGELGPRFHRDYLRSNRRRLLRGLSLRSSSGREPGLGSRDRFRRHTSILAWLHFDPHPKAFAAL